VPRPGLREELVERAARLDVGVGALEHLVRLVLRRLHVRLGARVDPEDRAGDSRRELPAVELLAELVGRRQAYLGRLAVRPLRRLLGRGGRAVAVLAGRLREQLLGPEAEAARAS